MNDNDKKRREQIAVKLYGARARQELAAKRGGGASIWRDMIGYKLFGWVYLLFPGRKPRD